MKLFDRLIDHVVDRVMARAKQNRPTYTVNNAVHIADRGIGYGAVHAAKMAAAEYERAMQHPGRPA